MKDKNRNLCDTCKNSMPTCLDRKNIKIKFGTGIGNDNVYRCDRYTKRWNLSIEELQKQIAIVHPRYANKGN
jgi:hypothetical protein